jgi:hypothetical protein
LALALGVGDGEGEGDGDVLGGLSVDPPSPASGAYTEMEREHTDTHTDLFRTKKRRSSWLGSGFATTRS